jgi:hypothetical protein
MANVAVTVTMNPLELKLFRRAVAKAADEGQLERTAALKRICELDTLRWKEEERISKPARQRSGRRRAA